MRRKGEARQLAPAMSNAASYSPVTGSTNCWTREALSWRSLPSRRTACSTTSVPERVPLPVSAGFGARMRHPRQRCDHQGRGVLPENSEEAPERSPTSELHSFAALMSPLPKSATETHDRQSVDSVVWTVGGAPQLFQMRGPRSASVSAGRPIAPGELQDDAHQAIRHRPDRLEATDSQSRLPPTAGTDLWSLRQEGAADR